MSQTTERLRVAYLMTHHPRVATTFISGEINGMRDGGAEITTIALNTPGDADLTTEEARREAAATLHLKGVPPLGLLRSLARTVASDPKGMAGVVLRALRSARLDLALAVRRLAHVVFAASVVEHLRDRDITHIHAHFGQAPATIAWFATMIGNLADDEEWTWSFTIHGFQDFVNESDARLDLKAQSVDFVACISDFTRSQLCRVTDPQHWPKFDVLRCGIDLEAFVDPEHPPIQSPPHVITVGRLSPEKGQVVLIDAIAQLHRDGIEASLEIIGSGPYEGALRDAVARRELERHVSFTGEQQPSVVAQRLGAGDIFCLASFSEGLPVSIMEAMAIGIPVVTTAISGIPELAIHDETALTVPPGNVEDLAAALRRMATEEGLAERITVAARSVVAERHDVRRTVADMRRRLERAAARPRSR